MTFGKALLIVTGGLLFGAIFWTGLAVTTQPIRPLVGPGVIGAAPGIAVAPAAQPAGLATRQGQAAPQTAPAGPSEPLTLKITGTDLNFDIKQITAAVGQRVDLTFENKGVIEHDFVIDSLNFKILAKPGQTVQGSFTPTRAGAIEYYCSIPGHKMAGMVGTLTVTDDSGAPAAQAPAAAAAQAPAAPTAPGQAQPLPAPRPPAPAGLRPLSLPQVAPPLPHRPPTTVSFELQTQELTALLDDGVAYTFWTFGDSVPGPMLRVRQGDTVNLTLKNSPSSQVSHSIDLHAVTGPGGGATVTQIAPGQSASFSFQALNPGVYVYHCATPMVPMHIANGMYGLIVVEPPDGFSPVDHEFYLMEGDFYLSGQRGEHGLHSFDMAKMLDETPDYVLFNGGVGSLTGANALKARVGETVRIFFGVGGPNLTSSFHVIGEIFDRVHPEGGSQSQSNIQTTLVPAGGSAIVEFKTEYPGTYTIVDHSLGRLVKGGAAILQVDGPADPTVFNPLSQPSTGPTAASAAR
ncbi:MAG: nitrite reductase, copper-containing [Chloroflexi bacterium]|nr:nitrite reductase, copper-containing [Chloroflexota bacterium]